MKETTKTSRSAGYLEKIFRTLNKDSFGGELEEPIITISPSLSAYGHVTVGKLWKKKNEWRHELNISAEWMSRPIENVVATMLHEMTHLYNLQHNIQDCSRGGTYHNRKFAEEAEKHMLKISKDDKYGWTITEPTDELLEYILKQGWEDLEMNRGLNLFPGDNDTTPKNKGTENGAGTKQKPKGSNSRKYVCPKCGAIVRATRDLEIICKPCEVEFELQ